MSSLCSEFVFRKSVFHSKSPNNESDRRRMRARVASFWMFFVEDDVVSDGNAVVGSAGGLL